MKHLFYGLTLFLISSTTLFAQHRDYAFALLREEVAALGKLTDPPKMFEVEGREAVDGIKPIYYDALPWQGKPTRVFAWMSLPDNVKGKVPGIVLVHGGGGTAFREWVKLWNDQGFAAISIAVEGQTDERVPEQRSWKRHDWGGPARAGIFADAYQQPLKEQWMYHALADTVMANSLLRSLPEVDADKIGLMGISWGGVITSGLIGIDNRFAFAIPTYGCGHLFDSDNHWGRALSENQMYRRVYDPMNWMDRVKMPVLWLSWPKDSHFPLDSQRACYQAGPKTRMVSLISGMGHSHQAGWKPGESYAFAKSIVETGKPWCEFTSMAVDNERVRAEFISSKRLDKAVLVMTEDVGFTGDREWTESEATLTQQEGKWIVTTSLPLNVTGWYVNVKSGNLTVSSDYQGE